MVAGEAVTLASGGSKATPILCSISMQFRERGSFAPASIPDALPPVCACQQQIIRSNKELCSTYHYCVLLLSLPASPRILRAVPRHSVSVLPTSALCNSARHYELLISPVS